MSFVGNKNGLLYAISNFLKNGLGSVDKILCQVDETTPYHLISAFSFLSEWISTQKNDNKEDLFVRDAFKIIGRIRERLPPVFLLNSKFDINHRSYKPHWGLSAFFLPINSRLMQLRTYIQPFAFYLHTNPTRISMFDRFLTCCNDEVDLDPVSKTAYIAYFKRLVLNHLPIEHLKILHDQRNSREILTKAFIEILSDLNNCRTATCDQIAFSFSYVFLYIYCLMVTNDIDVQMLCSFIQSRPFISPFLMLAIVNYIPPNFFMFNMITPHDMGDPKKRVNNIKMSQYNMHDFSIKKDSKLTDFVKYIPTIVNNYFLCSPDKVTKDLGEINNDADLLTYIHLSSKLTQQKMKDTLSYAAKEKISPIAVSCMEVLLLKWIISLQGTIIECGDNGMFTENYCYFLKSIIALLAPSFAESMSAKFLNTKNKSEDVTASIVNWFYYHELQMIVQNEYSEKANSFLFNALETEKARIIARPIIGKLLQCQPPKMTKDLLNYLTKCHDILTILEFIDILTINNKENFCEDDITIEEMKEGLINCLNIKDSINVIGGRLFVVNNFNNVKLDDLNGISRRIINWILRLRNEYAARGIQEMLEKEEKSYYSVLRIVSLTSLFQNPEVASLVVDLTCSMINTYTTPCNQKNLDIRDCEYGFVLGESILGRLVLYGFNDLVIKLLASMAKMLPNDSIPLHWVSRFILNYRNEMAPNVVKAIRDIVASLPNADTLFVRDSDRIIEIIAKILNDRVELLIQDPEVINSEYTSPYAYATQFSICSILLLDKSDDEIAQMLSLPVYDFTRIWPNRENDIYVLALLARKMSNSIACKYFMNILEHDPNNFAIIAGRAFLVDTNIDVFNEICEKSKTVINSSPIRLEAFLRMFLPSFMRLQTNRKVAVTLVCNLLESVNKETPREMQESVIDVTLLIFMKLHLFSYRSKFIAAAQNFSDDLKSIISISFNNEYSLF